MNYQKELEKLIQSFEKEGIKPSLLLHSCCAPCSSYCLEYLSQYFNITIYYYNPNITDDNEYLRRVREQKRLIESLNNDLGVSIQFAEGPHDKEEFFRLVKGYEDCPEGGDRCGICFEMRLGMAGRYASEHGFDYFTTTLTISPLKNAERLNNIGLGVASELSSLYLTSDFKKKNGYKRSIELSAVYDLYRQDYCGCIYSKMEMERRRNEKTDRNNF